MRIYHYNQTTGVFTGEDMADPSPLEPGVFLIPANATEIPPPPCPEGSRQVFVGGSWLIEEIPIPEPEPKPTASDMWIKIKSERDRRKAGGVKVGDKWFHSDDGSRIQQMGLVMIGASIPANLQWKTMDGTFITMTQTLASQVFQAVAASDQAIFGVAEAHRVAMEASADPAAYDYLTGWPAIFGE